MLALFGADASGQFTDNPAEAVEETVHGTPIDDLCKEEQIKHERNGLDIWDTMVEDAAANRFLRAAICSVISTSASFMWRRFRML